MKKVTVRESTRNKTESVLKTKDVTVLWATAYCKPPDVNTRIKVKCNVCGNTDDYSLGALTSGKCNCNSCLINKYANSCEKLNLKLIEKLGKDSNNNLLVECALCGERFEAYGPQIARGIFRCNGCVTNKYINACDKLNLRFLGKMYTNSVARLHTECKICSNRDSSASSDILAGKFRCEGCLHNKYIKSLESKGCSLLRIDKIPNKKSIIHYVNSSGDCLSARAVHVARGNFESSLNGHWYQNQSVYLIKLQVSNTISLYKIGTANDPHRRAKELKLNKQYNVFILSSFENRFESAKLESELHQEFAHYRLCSFEMLEHTESNRLRKDSKGKKYRVKDGITEWFSSEVYETLKVRYNLT